MSGSQSKKVLIVDDSPLMCQYMSDILNEIPNVTVVMAANGQEALDKLSKEMPDLIISDVVMPVMDGFQFYKELKKNPTTSAIPVIILTDRKKMEDTFKDAGADEFIPKTFEKSELAAKVNSLLNRLPAKANVAPQVKAGIKVLVAGSDNDTVGTIVNKSQQAGCLTEVALKGPDIISKSVVFRPQILLLEVEMEEGINIDEIIKMLRLMPDFAKAPILVYSFYSSIGSEDRVQKMLSIDSAQDRCLKAGATEYIGTFNENTFLKILCKYL